LNRGEWAFDLVVQIINARRGRRSAVDLPPESGEDTAMSVEPSFSQGVVVPVLRKTALFLDLVL
jgi:hypothetical protein